MTNAEMFCKISTILWWYTLKVGFFYRKNSRENKMIFVWMYSAFIYWCLRRFKSTIDTLWTKKVLKVASLRPKCRMTTIDENQLVLIYLIWPLQAPCNQNPNLMWISPLLITILFHCVAVCNLHINCPRFREQSKSRAFFFAFANYGGLKVKKTYSIASWSDLCMASN